MPSFVSPNANLPLILFPPVQGVLNAKILPFYFTQLKNDCVHWVALVSKNWK